MQDSDLGLQGLLFAEDSHRLMYRVAAAVMPPAQILHILRRQELERMKVQSPVSWHAWKATHGRRKRSRTILGAPTFSPLEIAACIGDLTLLRLALRQLQALHHDEKTRLLSRALCVAACYGRQHAVVELLESGAPVNAGDEKIGTPLHLAAQRNDAELVTLLLDRGVDAALCWRGHGGWRGHGTVMYVVTEWCSAAVANVLLSRGVPADREALLHCTSLLREMMQSSQD